MYLRIIRKSTDINESIHKISVIFTGNKVNKEQKLTVSPFTNITYNHYAIPSFRSGDEITFANERLMVTGPKTVDDLYAIYHGRIKQVLIELSPSTFYKLFGRSPCSFANNAVPLSSFISKVHVNSLLNSLQKSNNCKTHIKNLTTFIYDLVKESRSNVNYIEDALKIIEMSKANIGIKTVCKQIGKCERQFNRRFTDVTGISPKKYIDIRRIHFIIQSIQSREFKTFKDLAYDSGFYDPAHFSHSFKEMTGMTPGAFIKNTNLLAHQYYGDHI